MVVLYRRSIWAPISAATERAPPNPGGIWVPIFINSLLLDFLTLLNFFPDFFFSFEEFFTLIFLFDFFLSSRFRVFYSFRFFSLFCFPVLELLPISICFAQQQFYYLYSSFLFSISVLLFFGFSTRFCSFPLYFCICFLPPSTISLWIKNVNLLSYQFCINIILL